MKQVEPPLWMRMVQAVYSYDAGDVQALEAKFLQLYINTVEKTIRNELRTLGCSDRNVKLTDLQTIGELEDDARRWVASVVRTYNRFLEGAVNATVSAYRESHGGTLRGINRYVLASRMRGPIRNYWRGKRRPASQGGGWKQGKLQQIAITESTRAHSRAFMRFKERSGLMDDEVRLVPLGAVCDVCRQAVAMGWIKASVAAQMNTPFHVACPHNWASRRDEGKKIDCANMWRGG